MGQPGRSQRPRASRWARAEVGGAGGEVAQQRRRRAVAGRRAGPADRVGGTESRQRRWQRAPGPTAGRARGAARARWRDSRSSHRERGEPDGVVERLVLRRRDLGVPVPAAVERVAAPPGRPGPAPPTRSASKTLPRRHVEEDLRQVLAADQVDVVDAQVDRRHLVPGGAAGPLPLDHLGQPAPEAVARPPGRPARSPRPRGTRRRRRRRRAAPSGAPTSRATGCASPGCATARRRRCRPARACRAPCRARSRWCGRSASTHPSTAAGLAPGPRGLPTRRRGTGPLRPGPAALLGEQRGELELERADRGLGRRSATRCSRRRRRRCRCGR